MEVKEIKAYADRICDNISKVIIGKEKETIVILAAVFAGGNILIEDKPGTGKTMFAKTFAKSIDGEFKRVQFTPDLMPSDITGLNIYNRKTEEFTLVKGPVFTNILLADEINRATPRTQSSLLEAMEEKQVTIDGESYILKKPFVVIATENPVETTGTYPLPEAQLDRFMIKLSLGDNEKENEIGIIDRYISGNPIEDTEVVCKAEDINEIQNAVKNVFVHPCIREYIVDIILETRNNSKINIGASARGTLSLLRCAQAYAAVKGREFVKPDDVRFVAPYVLGHRILTVGHADEKKEKSIIAGLVDGVQVPTENWEK